MIGCNALVLYVSLHIFLLQGVCFDLRKSKYIPRWQFTVDFKILYSIFYLQFIDMSLELFPKTFLTSVCFIIPGSNSDNKCSIGHKHVLWKPVMWRKQIPRHFKYIFEDCTCNIWNALTLYLCIRSYTKGRIYHTFFIPSRPKNDSYMYLNCKFRVCELNTRV